MWPLRFVKPLAAPPSAALRFGASSVVSGVEGRLPLAVSAQMAWRAPEARRALAGVVWGTAGTMAVHAQAGWAGRSGAQGVAVLPWGAAAVLVPTAALLPWSATLALALVVTAGWRRTAAMGGVRVLPWGSGGPASKSVSVGWGSALPASCRVTGPWQGALAQQKALLAVWHGALALRLMRVLPWGPGERVTGFGSAWVPYAPPLPPVANPCYHPDPALRFLDLLARLAQLVFACRHDALVRVLPKEVYVITDSASLVRIDSGNSIPVISMSLSIDVDSWTVGFSASLPGSALALIEPNVYGDPVELLATANGVGFRVVVESMGRDRVFGQLAVRVQGRGRSSLLDAPYWPQSQFGNAGGALTSQQLVDQALPSGWSAFWGLEAWLVPAGVWLHQGTPISAVLAVAAAGGGYLQSHRTDATLQVLPRYPLAPWAWAAAVPDLELPAQVVERETIEWLTKPAYNGVYVSGVRDGVLRLVKRAGTAGDVVAPLVTDPLITREAAARQRGLAVLCDTGRQAQVGLQLPVLAETGVILPGKLVRYVDAGITRVGLTRGVRVDVAFGQITQTINLETHV